MMCVEQVWTLSSAPSSPSVGSVCTATTPLIRVLSRDNNRQRTVPISSRLSLLLCVSAFKPFSFSSTGVQRKSASASKLPSSYTAKNYSVTQYSSAGFSTRRQILQATANTRLIRTASQKILPSTPTPFCYVLQLKDLRRSVVDRYATKGLKWDFLKKDTPTLPPLFC
jgi:hypothetical protein